MIRVVIFGLLLGACLCGETKPPAPPVPSVPKADPGAPKVVPAVPKVAPKVGPEVVTPPPVVCGEIPNKVYECLGNPKIIKPKVSSKCDRSISACDQVRCIFKKSGWMKGDNIDKLSIINHVTQFARDKPEWTPATLYMKEQCLNKPLSPQSIHLGCPEYDIMHCITTAFLTQATPTQWASTPECDQAKAFVANCPPCPGDCFAAAIPIGSCNACLAWPKKA